MPQIQQYIREEVARQLSLVATINETPTTLDHSLRRAIQTQVAEALPSPASPISVAAPLTYAEAVRRPPAEPPLPSYGPATNYYRSPVSVYPVNRPFPPPRAPVNSWRTPDNRPVCYNCGIPGHVARYCRRPGFYFNDVQHSGNIPRQSESHVTPDSHDPRSRRPDFTPSSDSFPHASPFQPRPGGKLTVAVPEARAAPPMKFPRPHLSPPNEIAVFVDGFATTALVDTGAAICIISEVLCRKLNKVTTPLVEISLRTASSQHVQPFATCTARVVIQGVLYIVEFVVLLHASREIILGWNFLSANHAVNNNEM
ncbi:uncharacterized protein LOC142771751 isoform X1 [Rhipicephalus microplus]|uniref:uncharacterized protein LOC142771751 isoform X1 n=1 Tax=Rhipicephalus microplus TaxID=6941 RepID=UPI003F6C5085